MTWSRKVKIEYHLFFVLGTWVKRINIRDCKRLVKELNLITYDQITTLVFFHLCPQMYFVRYPLLLSGQLLG